ncbi:MAG: DnaJ domain-containing protein [Tyzzerella sp.]|nr:DnaJ domain-containing protein [Tyzzerella sp.]
MDQLTAYRVLGLEPGSSPEQIKEAYAALSKQYHPEEEPEKFQEIHEAYVTLTRRKRRGSVQNAYQENEEIQEVKESQSRFNFEEIKPEPEVIKEEPKKEYDFNKVEMEHNVRKAPEYSFEEAMQKAKQEEQAKSHELVLEAAAELKVLVSPKYKNQIKAYKSFLEDKKYESIIKRADFLEKLCDVLEETKLKKNIYDYIIDFYRLRGRNPSELSQIGLRLYRILDEKAGIKQKVNPGVYGGVVAGLVMAFRALRPVIRQSEILTTIVLCIVAIFLFVWICKKVKEKHSPLFTQAVIAIGIALSQFVVIMFDLYGTLFGMVDDGNTIAALIFLAAMTWFTVVIIIAVVKAVVGLVKGK